MQASLYTAGLFIIAGCSTVVAIMAWRRAGQLELRLFVWLLICVVLWCFGRGMEILSATLATKILWAKVEYVGVLLSPVLWLLFALSYTGRQRRVSRAARLLFWVIPAATILLMITNEVHGLVWTADDSGTVGSSSELAFAQGPWFWAAVAYSYLLVLAGMVVLAASASRARGVNRVRPLLLMAGAVFPLLANLAFVSGLTANDLTPIAFGVTGILYGWSILRLQMLDIVPLARSLLVEDLKDAILVLDTSGQILDFNRAAQRTLGLDSRPGAIGAQLASVSPVWSAALSQFNPSRTAAEVKVDDADFEVSFSPIKAASGQAPGSLFVIHNVSVRKTAEHRLQESEARFRALVQTAPAAMILTDTQGRIVQANRRVGDLFGYQPADLAGESIGLLIPDYPAAARGDPRLGVRDQITQPTATGQEMSGLHRDGREIPLAISYSPLITADGLVYNNIVHELTTLRETERQLQLQGQALRAAANGIVLTNLEGEILWVNPAFSEITGYLAHEVIGKRPNLLRSGAHGSDFYEQMWKTILRGEVWRGEITNRRKGGTLYTEDQTISPVLDVRGNVSHFIAIKQDITEQKRAQQQLQQRARELAIMNEIGQAAASNLDLGSLIELAGDKIRQIFDAWMVYIALLDHERALIEFPYYVVAGEPLHRAGTLSLGKGLTSVVIREAQPLLIDEDYVAKADLLGVVVDDIPDGIRPKTWMGVPIISGEQVIGVLSVQDAERERAYSQDDLRLLTTIAANLGVAIQNARLYQTEQQRRVVAETLQQVAAALTASLNRDEVLTIILEQLKRVVHYDSASIMQWDENRALRVAAHAGFRNPLQIEFVANEESAPRLWKVVTEKNHALVGDTWDDPGWNRSSSHADYIRCWIGIPLIISQEAIGVLNIDSEQPFSYTEDDVRIASLFADQAAIAIENARLYEKAQYEIWSRKQTEASLREANRSMLQQIREITILQEQLREQALRDPVTGLYNRRFLSESLPREIARAQRERTQVGAIMMDLDHFKAINDAYGHINGDKALMALAQLLQSRSRPSDIACRFGGEEFCLVMPGASLGAVAERAEELRAAFENIETRVGQASFRVTISLGAAIFPFHADSADDLLAHADTALYQAKRAGRNCVVIWSSTHPEIRVSPS